MLKVRVVHKRKESIKIACSKSCRIESDPKSGSINQGAGTELYRVEGGPLTKSISNKNQDRVNSFQKCLLSASHGKELLAHKNKCMENW